MFLKSGRSNFSKDTLENQMAEEFAYLLSKRKGEITPEDVQILLEDVADNPNMIPRPTYGLGEQGRIWKSRESEARREKEEEEHRESVKEQALAMETPQNYINRYATDIRAQGIHADDITDGLILSVQNLGRVDIEYISKITNASLGGVIKALKGRIYQNPATWGECFYKGWETADEYLSGNVVEKYRRARKANEDYAGCFSDSLDALKAVQPKKLSYGDIYVTLGSPWVPESVINEFIYYMLGKRDIGVRAFKDPYTGTWTIKGKNLYKNAVRMTDTYGTDAINGLYILEKTLNMKTIAVRHKASWYEDEDDPDSVDDDYIAFSERELTLEALEKQDFMIKTFQKWIWTDEKRAQKLQTAYMRTYACYRKRTFNGSFLTFPGMSEDVSLYRYQKDAVARIISTPNTLLAHEVGAGKTYIMVAAAQEMLRMGLSTKNLIVVPNNILGQWETIYKQMYPLADILVVDPKMFTAQKRQQTLKRMRDERHDAIIMPISSFKLIPVSAKYKADMIESEMEKIMVVDSLKRSSKLNKKHKKLNKALENARYEEREQDKGLITFNDLGITRLFVDESHNFKNLKVETNIKGVYGLGNAASKQCEDMLDKVRIVQSENGGGGVIMATGTPLTNSVTDAYVLQKYLFYDELTRMGIQNFDSWIALFGEKVTDFEIDVDTSGYRLVTRFSKFHNLPELTAQLALFADFHEAEGMKDIPKTDGYTDVTIKKTPEFDAYLRSISRRADDVRSSRVSPSEDNMLCITTDGRLAALDLRLKVPSAPFTMNSKVAVCAQNVFDIYLKYLHINATQLVFCDTSTPKEKFNIYDELKGLLVDMGIPEGKIAYIHDAQTEDERKELFSRMREGSIRVLIGSTFKMGLGMNVQDKLIAIHHIDIPWRPADMVQREGRILRPGNTNEKVFIYRYITEGSFDAYSWQLLENKQRFISQLLSGSYVQRSGGDIRDSVLDYAEVKALAVGNPLIKKRVTTQNELNTLLTLKRKSEENRAEMTQRLRELPKAIEEESGRAQRCQGDIDAYKAFMSAYEGLDEWREAMKEKAKKAKEEKLKEKEDAQKSSQEDVSDTAQKDVPDTYQDDDTDDMEEITVIEDESVTPEEKAKNRAFRAMQSDIVEDRKRARGELMGALEKYKNHFAEERATSFRGFDIFIPAVQDDKVPFVWIKRQGTYYVPIGDKSLGYIKRVENFLEGLPAVYDRYNGKLSALLKSEKDLKEELAKTQDYDERIKAVTKELEKIDAELGVDR